MRRRDGRVPGGADTLQDGPETFYEAKSMETPRTVWTGHRSWPEEAPLASQGDEVSRNITDAVH